MPNAIRRGCVQTVKKAPSSSCKVSRPCEDVVELNETEVVAFAFVEFVELNETEVVSFAFVDVVESNETEVVAFAFVKTWEFSKTGATSATTTVKASFPRFSATFEEMAAPI